MNVILVITKLFEGQIVPLFKAMDSVTYSINNLRIQKGSSVLHRTDDVVMGVVSTVVTLGNSHASDCI
jgi:hypothetical protein